MLIKWHETLEFRKRINFAFFVSFVLRWNTKNRHKRRTKTKVNMHVTPFPSVSYGQSANTADYFNKCLSSNGFSSRTLANKNICHMRVRIERDRNIAFLLGVNQFNTPAKHLAEHHVSMQYAVEQSVRHFHFHDLSTIQLIVFYRR